jgi:hypothetical protein
LKVQEIIKKSILKKIVKYPIVYLRMDFLLIKKIRTILILFSKNMNCLKNLGKGAMPAFINPYTNPMESSMRLKNSEYRKNMFSNSRKIL